MPSNNEFSEVKEFKEFINRVTLDVFKNNQARRQDSLENYTPYLATRSNISHEIDVSNFEIKESYLHLIRNFCASR